MYHRFECRASTALEHALAAGRLDAVVGVGAEPCLSYGCLGEFLATEWGVLPICDGRVHFKTLRGLQRRARVEECDLADIAPMAKPHQGEGPWYRKIGFANLFT